MARGLVQTVNADNLLSLRAALEVKGLQSDMLDVRLEFNEQHQVLTQYLARMYDGEKSPERVYPHSLPTQTSGRWSITNPPLNNFPPDIRDCICPDPGWPWIVWDLDAIEAKIVACYSHDRDDLLAFDQNLDIHVLTACKMTGMELPPDLKDPHRSDQAADWRVKYDWKGKDDKRRLLAKVRYCLLYGRDATAVHGSKYERDMSKLGFDKSVIFRAAQQFLAAKPNLVACKRRYWEQCAKSGEARTIMGRRRKLFGDHFTKAKEGWNHMVQGLVVDMTNLAIIETCQKPNHLVYQSHDGVKVAVPVSALLKTFGVPSIFEETQWGFKRAVEREWIIDGEKLISTATWSIYWPDGTKTKF